MGIQELLQSLDFFYWTAEQPGLEREWPLLPCDLIPINDCTLRLFFLFFLFINDSAYYSDRTWNIISCETMDSGVALDYRGLGHTRKLRVCLWHVGPSLTWKWEEMGVSCIGMGNANNHCRRSTLQSRNACSAIGEETGGTTADVWGWEISRPLWQTKGLTFWFSRLCLEHRNNNRLPTVNIINRNGTTHSYNETIIKKWYVYAYRTGLLELVKV